MQQVQFTAGLQNEADDKPRMLPSEGTSLQIWVQLGCSTTSGGFLWAPKQAIGAVRFQPVTSETSAVTAEAAGSSPVVPAIPFKELSGVTPETRVRQFHPQTSSSLRHLWRRRLAFSLRRPQPAALARSSPVAVGAAPGSGASAYPCGEDLREMTLIGKSAGGSLLHLGRSHKAASDEAFSEASFWLDAPTC